MNDANTPDGPVRQELRHEARPGYRTLFFIVFAAGVVYLALVFGLGIGAH